MPLLLFLASTYSKQMFNLRYTITALVLLCLLAGSSKAFNPSPDSTKRVKNIVYIEVNHHNPLNAGGYVYADTGKPFFEIAIVFAANINYSQTQKRTALYCNPNVRQVLHNRNQYIKPLQDKGIKVLLSILGNHSGAGFTNFQSREAAKQFAQQVADTVRNNNLDGVDFDEEYVEYKAEWPQNNQSLLWLVSELRQLLPDKIISMYDMDIKPDMKANADGKLSDYINYAWQPYYGKFSAPVYPGLSNDKIAPGAIDVTQSKTELYRDFAKKTKKGNYGWMMFYNLTNKDISAELSAASKLLNKTDVKATDANHAWNKQNGEDKDWEAAVGLK